MALSADILDLMNEDTAALMARAAAIRDSVHGRIQSYSPKVFIPLTHLCRDVCHYCTFSKPPKKGEAAYMTIEQVLDVAPSRCRRRLHRGIVHVG